MTAIGDISELARRGLLVSSSDFAVERLPDGRSKINLLRSLIAPSVVAACGGNCSPGTAFPATFSVAWHAECSINGCADMDFSRNFYKLCCMPWCNDTGCFTPDDTCLGGSVIWLQSFSPEWYDWWGSPPNADTGDWCEALGNGPSENHTVVCSCNAVATAAIYMQLTPRFGTVNGDTGWHVLLLAQGITSAQAGCSSSGVINTGYFNAFLGSTLNGTVTTSIAPFTWTWTISS